MYIITGKYKNHRISTPTKYFQVDPKIRHAIFNILGNKIMNASILDLSTYNGILGFESLSRGARFATINAQDYPSYKLIKKNTDILKIEPMKIKVCHGNVSNFKANFNQVDIVFSSIETDEFGLHLEIITHIKKNKGTLKKIIYIMQSNEQESLYINDYIENDQSQNKLIIADLHGKRRYGKDFLQFFEI